MNDEQIQQLLRELKKIRICAVISATVFVVMAVVYILNIKV